MSVRYWNLHEGTQRFMARAVPCSQFEVKFIIFMSAIQQRILQFLASFVYCDLIFDEKVTGFQATKETF